MKNAYYAVLLAKEVFGVYREVYDNAKANYQQTEKKYNAQKASELDMVTSRTNLANAIPNVYDAESNVILALWQLKAVIGMDLEEQVDVVGKMEDYSDNMSTYQEARDSIDLSRNSSIRQLSLQAEQLLETVKLRQRAYIPTLSASINFSYSSVANDPIRKLGWFPYSNAGLTLSIPIFSGMKRLNDVRQARNQYEQMQLQTRNTEKQLRIGVRGYLSTMDTAVKSYHASRNALESAQKAYDIASKSYEVGRATLVELDNAQLRLTQSRLSLSQNVYNYITAKAELESMLGLENVELN